jgi:hypothetical protein
MSGLKREPVIEPTEIGAAMKSVSSCARLSNPTDFLFSRCERPYLRKCLLRWITGGAAESR